MNYLKIISIILLIAIFSGFLHAQEPRSIGVNLTTISNYGSMWMFKDLIKQSSGWMLQHRDGHDWNIDSLNGQPVEVPVDSNGYPLYAPIIIGTDTLRPNLIMLQNQPEPWYYPAGDYTLIFEGKGLLIATWDVDGEGQAFTEGGTHTVTISNPTELGVNLIIDSSDVNDPIRNIRFIFPGYAGDYEADPFLPRFKTVVEPFPVLRFMKPLFVEENLISSWDDRTLVSDMTYYTDGWGSVTPGLPYELLIRFCNEQQKDPWINVPFAADDNYIIRMAEVFRDSLEQERTIYLEYSNETWNTDYPHTKTHMETMGISQSLSTDTFAAGIQYYTKRSIEIFEIFDSVFAGQSGRVVDILATQAYDYVGGILINSLKDNNVNPNGTMPGALAIAPYMGGEIIYNLHQQGVNSCDVTAAQILDSLELNTPGLLEELVPSYKHWADSLNIPLYAYEGGQHVAPFEFQPADSCMAEAVVGANRHERMQDVYCNYYDLWYDTYGGDLLMTFNLSQAYNEWGGFGLLESIWQDTATSNKWKAHHKCFFADIPTNVNDTGAEEKFIVYPNPAGDQVYVKFNNASEDAFMEISDIVGRTVLSAPLKTTEKVIDISGLNPGIYLIRVRSKAYGAVERLLVHR